MRSVKVSNLMLEGTLVGYRFIIIEGDSVIISFDTGVENYYSILQLIDDKDICKGESIVGRLEGELFVTDDEETVFEVPNRDKALELLSIYYFRFSARKVQGNIRYFNEDNVIKFSHMPNVSRALKVFNRCTLGVYCDLRCTTSVGDKSGIIKVSVAFDDIVELGKFAGNLVNLRKRTKESLDKDGVPYRGTTGFMMYGRLLGDFGFKPVSIVEDDYTSFSSKLVGLQGDVGNSMFEGYLCNLKVCMMNDVMVINYYMDVSGKVDSSDRMCMGVL